MTDPEVLQRAADDGSQAIITNDKSMGKQTNLQSLPLAIVVFPSGDFRKWSGHIEEIAQACQTAEAGTVIEVPRSTNASS
jgi:hypothetical protein